MANKGLIIILQITNAAEKALIAFIKNDQKGVRRYLQAARDAIDSILETL